MIVITAELWPRGDEKRAKVIGRGTITNVGGSETRGKYRVELERQRGLWRVGRVDDFPRKRLSVWHLLLRGLLDAFDEPGGEPPR